MGFKGGKKILIHKKRKYFILKRWFFPTFLFANNMQSYDPFIIHPKQSYFQLTSTEYQKISCLLISHIMISLSSALLQNIWTHTKTITLASFDIKFY